MLDNLVIETISSFFYSSFIMEQLSRYGFFCSHFRFLRRGVTSFRLKLFFVPNSASFLPSAFVETEELSVQSFFKVVALKTMQLSKALSCWYTLFYRRLLGPQGVLQKNPLRSVSQKKKNMSLASMLRFKEISLVKGGSPEALDVSVVPAVARAPLVKVTSKIKMSRRLGPRKRSGTLGCSNQQVLYYLRKKFLVGLLSTELLVSSAARPSYKTVAVHGNFCARAGWVSLARGLVVRNLALLRARFRAHMIFTRLRRLTAVNKFVCFLSELFSSFLTEALRPLVGDSFRVFASIFLLNHFKVLNPQFVARFLAKRLSYGMQLRKVLRPIVRDLSKLIVSSRGTLSGFKIKCSGRFNRTQMASMTVERFGSLSLSDVSRTVSFGYATAFLRYGACGIKIWLLSRYKPDLFLTNRLAGFDLSRLLNMVLVRLKKPKNLRCSKLQRGSALFYYRIFAAFFVNWLLLLHQEPLILNYSKEVSLVTLEEGLDEDLGEQEGFSSPNVSWYIFFIEVFLPLVFLVRYGKKQSYLSAVTRGKQRPGFSFKGRHSYE